MVAFKKNILLPVMLAGLSLTSCAYFNTFYNARVAFEKAEESRIRKTSEMLPRDAKENYQKVIAKCNRVIENYPDSKYVEEANFLIGVARYRLNEPLIAMNQFEAFINKYPESKWVPEAEYWIGLCRWKTGNAQYGLFTLNRVLNTDINNSLKSKIYLSLADIYLDQNDKTQAMDYFEMASDISKESHEKVLINERISDLAFKSNDWDRAEKAYKQVIKNSYLKDKKENAQLQIVKIYRMQKENDKAMSLIRKLLQDENFKTLHSELELEMAKLYIAEKEMDKAVSRLKKVTNDYPKTASSSEAYYLLGEDALMRLWNTEQAKEYYKNIATEFSNSIFRPFGQTRLREIGSYEENNTKYEGYLASLSGDTTSTIEKIELSEQELEALLFALAELEYLQFKRNELASQHFNELVKLNTGSELMVKSIYILANLNGVMGNPEQKAFFESRILDEFPFTDYAGDIRMQKGMKQDIETPGVLLIKAEEKWSEGLVQDALNLYRKTIKLDSTSSSAGISLLFLANYYENMEQDLDSAKLYYSLVKKTPLSGDYEKVANTSLQRISKFLDKDKEPTVQQETPEVSDQPLSVDEKVIEVPNSTSQDSTESDSNTPEINVNKEGTKKRGAVGIDRENTGKRTTTKRNNTESGDPEFD